MDSRIFSPTQQYNPGSWSVWDIVAILIGIPILDMYIYPLWTKTLGRPPSTLQKMGAGLGFSILALVLSGIVEILRRQSPVIPGLNSVCAQAGEMRPVNALSIWYQVPQYLCLGLAEILSVIAAYDLFYNQVPLEVKSASQGLNLLTTAMGGVLTSSVQSILTCVGTLPTNLNEGQQELLYCIQAAVGMGFLVAFVWVSQEFQYKHERSQVDIHPRSSSSLHFVRCETPGLFQPMS